MNIDALNQDRRTRVPSMLLALALCTGLAGCMVQETLPVPKLAAAQAVQPELHLRPDKAAKYDIVAAVMVSSQRLGLTRIGIVGSEQFVE